MGQQLPVGFYRSASVDGGDIMVEGQCPWMNLLFHVGREGVKRMARKANC